MHTAAPCLHLRLHFRTHLAAHAHLTRELRCLLRPVTTMTETSSYSSSVCSTRSLVRMPQQPPLGSSARTPFSAHPLMPSRSVRRRVRSPLP